MASLPVSVAQEITASWHQQVVQSSNINALYTSELFKSLLCAVAKAHFRKGNRQHSVFCTFSSFASQAVDDALSPARL